MSVTDFADPNQVIHIPARDLTGTREAKLAELDRLLAQLQVVRLVLSGHAVRLDDGGGAAGPHPPHRSRLWSWSARRLRGTRKAFAVGTADTKSERS